MRFDVMTVPGNREDGRDTAWFVIDRYTRRSELVGHGDSTRTIAFRRARAYNKAAREDRRLRERDAARRRRRLAREEAR